MSPSAHPPRSMPPPLPSRAEWIAIMHAVAVAAEECETGWPQGPTLIAAPHSPALDEEPPRRAETGPNQQRRSLSIPVDALLVVTQEVSAKYFKVARDIVESSLNKFMVSRGTQAAIEVGSSIGHSLEQALARERRRSSRILAVAAVVIFGWAAWVPLSGAVVVSGSLVMQSSVKKVQHPQGGIVTAILVGDGSKVAAGDELVRLDQTSARANLQVVARQLDEVRIRIARLKAERDKLQAPRWPSELAAEVDPAEQEELLASERGLFVARASARRGQQELAETRVDQLEKQIAALEAQLKSNGKQADITGGELRGVEELLRQKLVTLPRATALQREAAHLDGVEGQLIAQIAETRAKVSETRLQALQSEETFRSDVMRDLREAEAKEGELLERHLAARDQMARTVIRAPVAGTIHELALHTVGGVVTPAEVLMLLVPDGDTLAIEARLNADRVDQVHVGQTAHVRMSAFNQRTTPELAGIVELVSADIVRDAQSGATYYSVRIALPVDEVRRLGSLRLIPGMPAEVFLETESRTMLSYLFKPLTDQLSRMFRER
jgi:HlyD family secretion protein